MNTTIPEKEGFLDRLVLVVDDEPDMITMLRKMVEKKCQCGVITATSGLTAVKLLEEHQPDVVVTDIKMADLDGLQLLKKIRAYDSTISVIMMTGYGTIDMAVEALKKGAYDFLEKPFEKDHIVKVIKNCLERTKLLRTNQQLQKKLNKLELPEGFIGQSPPLRKTLDLLSRIADTDATVLIQGESGTGKEMAARALHSLSGRRKNGMVTVNCPALPENILESELFGYSKGAFTGAIQQKKGLFLEAQGSTILLDEIGDIPVSVQTKLLRVLQEKEIQPLGQNRTLKVDVRVVASTNQDLKTKIQQGEFREDLYYRLNVVSITMPALKEMKEDIPLLIHHFLTMFQKKYKRHDLNLTTEILQHLYQREWQGNVRELRNTIKRLVLLNSGKQLNLSDLDINHQSHGKDTHHQAERVDFHHLYSSSFNEAKAKVLEDFTLSYIHNLLLTHQGNVTNAAAACGLERQALQRIMRRYRILSKDFRQ